MGASWEGYAIDVVLDHLGARSGEAYFWGTHAGAELDLLIVRGSTRVGFEFKRTSSPSVTPSMRSALTDLRLQRLYVVHGGTETFPMTEQIVAVPLSRIAQDVPPFLRVGVASPLRSMDFVVRAGSHRASARDTPRRSPHS